VLPSDIKEARRMLDFFLSVGATRFNVTFLDLLGRKTHYFPLRTPPSMEHNLPSWMAQAALRKKCITEDGTEIIAGENLIVRPVCRIPETAVTFVQLDDLNAEQIERVRPASFLIFCTSPGNHQAWIAVRDYKGQPAILCNAVRNALGAGDYSATGSTRLAGTENFKPQYAADFPVVRILHGVRGRVMTSEMLQKMGLLRYAEPPATETRVGQNVQQRVFSGNRRPFPSYEMSLAGAPRSSKHHGPDRSKADWWWCYLAAQRGFTVDEIATELEKVSEKTREQLKIDKEYAIDKATDATQAWESKNSDRHRGRA
jgi:hypothetical protein